MTQGSPRPLAGRRRFLSASLEGHRDVRGTMADPPEIAASNLELADDELAALASACWTEAEDRPAQPFNEESIQAPIRAALEFASAADGRHRRARRLFEEFLRRGGRLLPRETDPFTTRLHWTYWLIAQRLCETSVPDPARRCAGPCESPQICPSAKNGTRTLCAQSLVFPFLHSAGGRTGWNLHKTALAIIRGLERAAVVREPTSGAPFQLEAPAVRQALQRFLSRH